jgi:hypothetical protein
MLAQSAPGAAPPRRHSPVAWFEDLGLRRADLVVFGAEVRLLADAGCAALLARHRDATGRETGWERVAAAPVGDPRSGRLRYAHTRGGAKALFRSPPGGGPGRQHRLLVADGALPAIAAAACDRRWSFTRYAGVGGVWTEAAAQAVRALVEDGIARVVLGFAATPAGERMARAALADLRSLPACVEVRHPDCGTWIATLQRQRAGLDPRPANPRVPAPEHGRW